MSVTTLELVEIVPYVWDCVLGQSVDPVAIELDWGDHKHLCAVISISGQWTGDVVLESSVEVARAAASRMFSTPEEDLAFDEVQDALAELANVIGGNIKSLVPARPISACPASPAAATSTTATRSPPSSAKPRSPPAAPASG